MKIFISIAAYQDPLLVSTIKSAFNRSLTPENLIFGICDQSSQPINIDKSIDADDFDGIDEFKNGDSYSKIAWKKSTIDKKYIKKA